MSLTELSAGVPPNTPAAECPVNSPTGGVVWILSSEKAEGGPLPEPLTEP